MSLTTTQGYPTGPTTVGTSPVFVTDGGYIVLPVAVDPNELFAAAVATIQATFPSWVPYEGHLEVAILEAVAQMVSVAAQVAANVPLAIFRYYGGTVGVPPEDGAAATVATTWTMVDTKGYTIPAGTYVAAAVSGNLSLIFSTVAAVTVPPGQAATTPGQVILSAASVGAAYDGVAGPYTLYDSLAYVSGIATTGPSSGGADAETDDAYLERLSGQLKLLSPRPILPPDFAALARSVPGVARALAVDGYNPVNSSSGNARMVAVACVDATGNALPAATTASVQTYLQSLREVNFVVNVIAPTYTAVAISASLVAVPGYSANAVAASVTAALTAFCSPGNWAGGNANPPAWRNVTTLRYLDIVGVVASVPGVDLTQPSVITLGVGATPTMGAADVSLIATPGAVVVLPTAGTMSVSVAPAP